MKNVVEHKIVNDNIITFVGKVKKNKLTVAAAICSNPAEFSQSRGKEISKGRIRKKVKVVNLEIKKTPQETLSKFAEETAKLSIPKIKLRLGMKLHAKEQQ